MRILLAEDEEGLAKGLGYLLEKNKYAVDIVHSGTDAIEYFRVFEYDAVILDIMMPGINGLKVLEMIRSEGSAVPVMMLTAKSDIEDRVKGLEAGADDYLPKPFATQEFLARVHALLRRSESYAGPLLTLGNTSLDCKKYVISCEDRSVRLNSREFQIVELLFRNPGKIFSADNLMDRIWPEDSDSDIGAVWTHIGYIRRKMKQIEADTEIKTIRGAGYTLERV